MVEITIILNGDLAVLSKRHDGVAERTTLVTPGSSLFDGVQAQGIPHVEVGSLTLNSQPATWDDHLAEGDELVVDPVGETGLSLDVPPLPDSPAFLLDVHLGRLAGYMRLAGIDTHYHAEDIGDPALVGTSADDDRILLTCDRRLLMHRAVRWGALLRNRNSFKQMQEVLDRFNLRSHTAPFTRCMACNGQLREATVPEIEAAAPPLVRVRYGLDPKHYQTCPDCGRLFWAGTHTDRMRTLLRQWGITG
ncbi:Mut7-C ubiquitin/RNAse domain-containing protein [bacterium]|nr:Mut7-C ubiquitin/RNAse domain-containing protein [bacterium]